MSKDIRSFFPTLSKKIVSVSTNNEQASSISKATKRSFSSIGSSSDDVVPGTPQQLKKRKTVTTKESSRSKSKRIIVLSSDSEPENSKKKSESSSKTIERPQKLKEFKKIEPETQKRISALDAFGDAPVKQQKLPANELEIHADDDFEQTLLQLDDEELFKAAGQSKPATAICVSTPKKTKYTNAHNESKTTPASSRKKKKTSDSDSGLDPDQERHERKRHSALLYQQYLNRSGPVNPGSKWIPHGKADCLKGLSFLISGVLESLERDDAQNLVTEHGGRCLKSVSAKVNYMVLGEDSGPAKLEKARALGTKMISEDELIDLICIKSKIKNQNKTVVATKNVVEEEIKTILNEKTKYDVKKKEVEEAGVLSVTEKNTNNFYKNTKPSTSKNMEMNEQITQKISNGKTTNDDKILIEDEIPSLTEKKTNSFYKTSSKPYTSKDLEIKQPIRQIKKDVKKISTVDMAWVDKYKPTDINQIIGQQGDKSNVNKLISWLKNWYRNLNGKARAARPSPWAKNDDGAYFKAALLSGPPGVGKTTSATLVAKHLGFDTVEFNASDTRNKKMVHKEIAQILKSTSIAGFVSQGAAPTKRHVLLMDEVDGMSGNEDRGGIQELIGLIKDSHIPIICMCNDRQHPKIRTLANYCFDLRFSKPRVEQIRGAMLSICFKEHVKINADAMTQVIQGTDMDVRQTLNQLSILAVNGSGVNSDQAEQQAKQSQKDSKLGPWEVIRKVFSEEDHKKMSIMDKSKLFFYDYSIGPLFVQENYLKVVPHCPRKDQLQRFADAADCISLGDLVDSKIRSTQNWSLLEMQAMYASVLPGHFLSGHFGGQIDFPGWLGKNSKRNKFHRMLTEVYGHTRTSTSGNQQALTLDYMSHIRDAIVYPLAHEGTSGITQAVRVMTDYKLLREDLTNIIELTHWPKSKDLFVTVDSKVKAAFTRAYNKDGAVLPYSTAPVKKKLGAALNTPDEVYDQYGEDYEDDEDEKDDDIAGYSMIKAKKPTKRESQAKTSKRKTAKSKEPK